jgi:integrase
MTTTATGGRPTRAPVTHAGRTVPGLYERTTAAGQRVFEVCSKRSGKVVRRRLAAQTTTDAVREQRALLAQFDQGVPVVRADLSLRQLYEQWAEWATGPGCNLASRTVESYRDTLDRHALRLLGERTKAVAVRPSNLRLMIDRLQAEGLSPWYVHGILTATSAMFRFAVRRDLVETNPVRALERGDRPSPRRLAEARYLDRSEIDRLLAKLSDGFRPIAAACAFAGLRVQEALDLTWQDVDFEAGMLHVPGTKTAASRQPVPMTSVLETELRAHRSRHPGVGTALLFTTADGKSRRRHAVGNAVRAAGNAAGLNLPGVKPVAPHDLRHSCAGLLFAAGVPLPKVAALLRHAHPRVTLSTYAGLVESQRAELRDDLEAALG